MAPQRGLTAEASVVTAWVVRYGFPARVVSDLVRAGVLESKSFSAARDELVRLCGTPEGRARVLAVAGVRAALREAGWKTDDLKAFLWAGRMPSRLRREYTASLRSESQLDRLVRRRSREIPLRTVRAVIPNLTPLRQPVRIPRPTVRPRTSRRHRSRTRLAAASSRDGPSSQAEPPLALAGGSS
jgi:hypothetical protein